MFKKAFESFFIIDSNEKPAPSFLAAYLIAWFFVHKQVITTFISTTGALDIRLNASIASVTENLYMQAFWWAIAFVIIRFALNNLIYFFRESFDHLTQFTLNKLNFKSFINNKVHQKILDDLAKSKADSHSFYDRAKAAEESETNAINKLGEFQESTQTEHYEFQQSIDLYKKDLIEESKKNNELNKTNNQLQQQLDISSEGLQKSLSAHEQLKLDHDSLLEERNKLNTELNESSKKKMDLKNEHRSLAFDFDELTKNYNNINDKLINANRYSTDLKVQVKNFSQESSDLLALNEELASNLISSENLNNIIQKQITKWAKKTEQPKLMLLGRNESELNNDEKILLDKILSSRVIEERTSNSKAESLSDLVKRSIAPKKPLVTTLSDLERIKE